MNAAQEKLIRRLEKAPKDYPKKDVHHWADYLELLCMVHPDGIISKSEFIDRTKNLASKNSYEDIDEEPDDEEGYTSTQIVFEKYIDDFFGVIDYRMNTLSIYYPFKLSEDSQTIEFEYGNSPQHKFYLFLLFCSSLGYCLDYKSKLTSLFETVCVRAMSRLLPHGSECHFFGSSNMTEVHGDSNFYNKVKLLVGKLGEKIVPHFTPKSVSKYNNGDGGLDVYGYVRLGDTQRHFPLFFAQCACTPKWIEKQNSSKRGRWDNIMTFSTTPVNVIFIPFSFRSSNGEWHDYSKIEDSILIDRHRLIYLFDCFIDDFQNMDFFEVIEEIRNCKEELV